MTNGTINAANEDFEYWIFNTGEGFEVLTEEHEYVTRKPDARLIVANGASPGDLHQLGRAFLNHLECHGFNGEGPERFASFTPSKAEQASGCTACDPEAHPPNTRDEITADIDAKIEGQLTIARHGSGWALIAKTDFWHDDPKDTPWVLFDGLQSEEAAQIAMVCARESYLDEVVRHPLGHDIPGEESSTRAWLNATGRILGVLLEADSISDLSKPDWAFVARRVYWAVMDRQPLSRECADRDSEIPF